jgi:hydroxymethylpyrimidine/phosphomethylpyrimidine kinase
MTPHVALSIAGTDSGGAAGLAADLATFAALGVHGACAVTAVTAQDTTGVHRIVPLGTDDVMAQVDAVFGDLPVAGVKTGVLGSAKTAEAVSALAQGHPAVPFVVDPVLVATSGDALASYDIVEAYRSQVLPAATAVTPNLDEALALLSNDASSISATQTKDIDELVDIALALHDLGPAVVLTGGDPGDEQQCIDVLIDHAGRPHLLPHDVIRTDNDHGTGCTFSAALAANLANGEPLVEATKRAQAFVAKALTVSARWRLGRGRGPVAHTFPNPSPTTEEPA